MVPATGGDQHAAAPSWLAGEYAITNSTATVRIHRRRRRDLDLTDLDWDLDMDTPHDASVSPRSNIRAPGVPIATVEGRTGSADAGSRQA
jgi:hypothetical protein